MEEPVTLISLHGGAAVELFDRELEKILKNIADPMTDPEAVRKITIEVVFKPTEDRDKGAVLIRAKSTLAGIKPAGTLVYFGRLKSGEYAAVESDPKQGSLFQKPGPTPITARP